MLIKLTSIMKNTIKYIITALFFSVAAFMSGFDAIAQNLPEGTYLEYNGLAYRKSATLQQDGTYLIDLEAFVTGTVSTVTQVPPVDIVLLLDYSSSMSNAIGNLRTAVAGFVKTIQDFNQKVVPDAVGGHRIALVLFDSGIFGKTTHTSYSSNLNKLLSVADFVPGANTVSYGGTNLIGYSLGNGTDTPEAMDQAKTILSDAFDNGDYNHTVTIAGEQYKRSRVVVMFTDGEPYSDSYGNGSNMVRSMNSCIGFSQDIINSEDYPATIYTVGLFSNRNADTQDHVTTYMRYASSANTGGQTVNTNANGNNYAPPYEKVDGKYSIIVTNSDALAGIFNSIAQSAGASDAQISSESTVTTDVVSNSFSVPSLPEGVPASSVVTVLVAPCDGQTTGDGGVKYLTFGEAKAPTEYGLPAITPSIDEETNSVSTTGFDFSDNFCWYDDVKKEGHGYKQIIRFHITVNDNAVGGPNVATNTDDSGIYVNGEKFVEFNIPSVQIPISIWIKKKGLDPNDSAVFNIGYAPYEAGVDPSTLEYKQFTKIMITKDTPRDPVDGFPVEKLVGLDPNYFYRIKEDAWAWSYTYQDGGVQYTVGEGGMNPFVFVNLPKETPKEAEATVRNVFEERTTEIVTTPTE